MPESYIGPPSAHACYIGPKRPAFKLMHCEYVVNNFGPPSALHPILNELEEEAME